MQNRYQPTLEGHRLRRCSKEQKCLHKAVSKHQPEMIELLTNRNDVNPNAFYKNHTPSQLAVWKSREDMVECSADKSRSHGSGERPDTAA